VNAVRTIEELACSVDDNETALVEALLGAL
jgi:hypothetical protein